MNKIKRSNAKLIFVIFTISILITGIIAPATMSKTTTKNNKGFGKGIPWKPFAPIKKTTFVQFDKNKLIDDYAYLSSIPASVFHNEGTIYCNPLLFYQQENKYPNENKYRFLNDYQGTDYLMKDWMSYSNGKLDKITTINMEESQLENNWNAKKTSNIKSENPYEIANKIALDEWAYSEEAVISVIKEDYEKPENKKTTNSMKGTLKGEIEEETLTIKRPYGSSPEFKKFKIDEEFKYVEANLWYPSLVYHSKLIGAIPDFSYGITIPSIDADLQLYTKDESVGWLQTSAASNMAITNGPVESCFSYVYNPGDWRIGVTNMPTEGIDSTSQQISHDSPLGKFTIFGKNSQAILNALGREVKKFNCEIIKYPGVELTIPDRPGFGTRDATFELNWENEEVDLGFTLIGPSGEELESSLEKNSKSQKIKIHQVGEVKEDENYKIVVYALNDISTSVNFNIDYHWNQNITKEKGDQIASASEGAVLASITNSPLLFMSPNTISQDTIDTINKLGVKKIHLIDINGYLKKEPQKKLENIVKIQNSFKDYESIYQKIMEITDQNDVVFSTIDPWSYWYYNESTTGLKPEGEFENAYYFAPATYAAAIHGSPLLLVDNHPELSSGVMWHNNLWNKHANGEERPSTAAMHLTGKRVYAFLEKHGFDQKGAESILTVAGQYDIGPSWTRVFAGVGEPGNIIGTPVDTTNWIARSVFYPVLIFENPALKGRVELINGSKSKRIQKPVIRSIARLIPGLTEGLSNLRVTRPSQSEEYTHPVLHTYGCYNHRFNERGSEYWGVPYQTRTGHTPGYDLSNLAIDQGTREKYEDKAGSFLPDLSETEITPFYASKAGYSNAFSTNYEITIDNLNQGVISWYMVLHGWSGLGGSLSWWEPDAISQYMQQAGLSPGIANFLNKLVGVPLGLNPITETNPWRGYDMLWGSTEEPDTATLNSKIGLLLGWSGLGNPNGPLNGGILKTGLDIVPSNIPLLKFNRKNYHDGLVGPFSLTALFAKFRISHPAKEIDDKLDNLHSMSFHANSCLIAGNYLQIALLRHGSVMHEIDPWPTSYWGGYVFQQTPKDYALGETVGESFAKGRTEIGVKYLFEEDEKPEWWWDTAENVVLFSDPDLRIWIPSDEWDSDAKNHWDPDDVKSLDYGNVDLGGHKPFGVEEYPHIKTEDNFIYIVIVATAVIIGLASVLLWSRRKQK
ncbi:MAG: hypothetical protein V5A68_00710 [Candidatus Thermoplasmatota archaeon]